MEIIYTSLHHINHASDVVNEIDISTQTEDLSRYTDRLIEEITTSTNKRQFKFRSDTTEVRNAISRFLESDFSEGSRINSNRLLGVEKDAQARIDHLGKVIQKGSLFQAVLQENGETTIIISKADHNQFLDEVDFTLKHGLPWEKRIFKAFLVKFSNSVAPVMYVYDTTSRMARYWWDNFLELDELYTDTHNTQTSLKILDSKILNKIKKQYPADHLILRNTTIGYFRNNDEFEINGYIENVFSNYEPVDAGFPKEEVVSKIVALPERYKFDTRFGIIREEIKKRQIHKIALTESIDLVIKDHVANLDEFIKAEQDIEGNKYIKIKTDEGFNKFNKQNQ